MPLLNRSAIILTPKQPYIDWANSTEGPRFELRDEDDALTVFLGPDVDYAEEARAFVNRNFSFFFEELLEQWCTDDSLWPARRTRKLFAEWFDLRIHTMVVDTVDLPYELN